MRLIVHVPVLLIDAHHLLFLDLRAVVKLLTNLLWLSLDYSFIVAWSRLTGLGSLAAARLLLRW